MKGRTPTKAEQKWLNDICGFGCIVCYNEHGIEDCPASPHHINGKTAPDAHFNSIPLCFYHHQGHTSEHFIARHPNKTKFEAAYGSEQKLLQQMREIINGG